MKISLSRILVSLLMLFCASISFAHKGSFRCIVSEVSTAKPIEGANILIQPGNIIASTDAFGRFFVKNLEPGKYDVIIGYLGYEREVRSVKVEDGETTELQIKMIKTSINMESVSVTGKKDNLLSCISGLDLKMRPVNNSQDLLRLVPGLFTAQHQGGGKAEQIFLRGFDCDHGTDINVSVDNMPVNMVSHAHGQGFADTHFIIPESIQELDYGKGPYQLDKGNLCTAGFASYKTRNLLENSFVKAEGGMYGYFRSAFGVNLLSTTDGEHTHHDAYIVGEYAYNKSYFDVPQNFNRYSIFGKYTNYISESKILSVSLSGFSSLWDASGQLPERAVNQNIVGRFGEIDPEGGNTSRYNLNLQYFQAIGNNAYFKSNLYAVYYKFRLYSDFTYYAVDSINGDQVRQAESRFLTGYNNELSKNYTFCGLKMQSQMGLGLRSDDIINDELTHTAGQTVVINPIQLGDVQETNLYGYLGQQINFTPKLSANFGTRYDVFFQKYIDKLSTDQKQSAFTHSCISPKLGVNYNLSPKARLYYNYGTGFHTNDTRTLALGQLRNSDGIIDHTIPLAFSQDLGVIVKPVRALLLSAALWCLNLQQEYTYSGDVAVIDTNGKTRRYGIDLTARYQCLKHLYLDVDLNYAHGRFIDAAVGANFIPLAPIFTSTGGASYRFSKNISAGLRYRHMSNRPANATNTHTALGYTVCDAVANYSLQHFEFGMQIQNLFNVQWREAQFDTQTWLRQEVAAGKPAVADVCYTPGTPLFLKLSASYKF